MTTRHLVDPELEPLIEQFPAFDLSLAALPIIRAGQDSRFGVLPEPPISAIEERAPGIGGAPDVPVFVYKPNRDKMRAAILHIHGGGMVMGSAASFRHTPSSLAASHDAVAVSVEYRLAPETPFPGPQEDCYAALAWLFANAAELGIDPNRVIIAGESAGGGLAAALALMVRDKGEYQIAGQILIYPMLDHRVGGPDDPWQNPTTGEFVWTPEKNQFGWEALRGSYACEDDRVGWFSPARAQDLSGLPPTWIGTGTLDLFYDENLDFARRLSMAGVSAELRTYPGAFHGFNLFAQTMIARNFARDLNAAFARMLT